MNLTSYFDWNETTYLPKQKKIVRWVLVNTGPRTDILRKYCVFPAFNVVAGASECDILLGVTTVVPLPIPLHRKTTPFRICDNTLFTFFLQSNFKSNWNDSFNLFKQNT